MATYYFNNDDIEQLELLTKVTNGTYRLYKRLSELEINEEKDSDEYKRLLGYLNMAIDIEQNKYKAFDFYYNKAIAWNNYIYKHQLPGDFTPDMDSITDCDYEYLVQRRILSNLFDIVLSNCDKTKEALSSNIQDFMKDAGLKDLTVTDNIFYGYWAIKKELTVDLYKACLFMLKNYIDEPVYSNLKEALILTKYQIAFLSPRMEKALINDNFNLPHDLYFNSKFISDCFKQDEKFYQSLRDNYGINTCFKQISKLVEISDLDYNNPTMLSHVILLQCFLRASFLFMDEDSIEDTNSSFHNFIKDSQYLDRHAIDKISVSLINDCYNKVKEDKSKVRILSLNK